jgi:membrane-anchored protein YejM (alkaline phosphatase superfamily)
LESYLQTAVKKGADDEASAAIYEQYHSTLQEFDCQLGEILKMLKGRERTTVILTSDHGHSFATTEDRLADAEIRTPFLIWSNDFNLACDGSSRVVESSVDLLPTITKLYGIDDSGQRSGEAIFDDEGRIIPKDFAVSELVYLDRYQIKVIGQKGQRVVFEAPRNRKTFKIDLDAMRIKTEGDGSENILRYIRSARLNHDLKRVMCALIEAQEN